MEIMFQSQVVQRIKARESEEALSVSAKTNVSLLQHFGTVSYIAEKNIPAGLIQNSTPERKANCLLCDVAFVRLEHDSNDKSKHEEQKHFLRVQSFRFKNESYIR
jgi:hypothetical protein